ncbi:hypothetical protein P3W33_12930 [Luteibacter sp. PPL552]|jgi:hypothetical protein
MYFHAMKNAGRRRWATAAALLAVVPATHAAAACQRAASLSAHGAQVAFAQGRGAAGEHVALYCDQPHSVLDALSAH